MSVGCQHLLQDGIRQCSAMTPLQSLTRPYVGCKQVRQAGLRCALSAKAHEGRLIVMDTLAVPEAKTVRMMVVLHHAYPGCGS